jgi:ribosome recycling factor
MDVTDIKGLNAEVKKRMDGAIEHVRKELSGLRSGRASVSILDPVQVEAYGAMMPLNQVATMSVPEPTVIMVQPFDPTQLAAVERAILKANLGLNPASDGKLIRVPIPPLTEERRREMSRLVHKYAEDARNSVRQVRRDANDRLKKLLKDHQISEDDERRALEDVQRITDQHVGFIDEIQKKKDQELLGR